MDLHNFIINAHMINTFTHVVVTVDRKTEDKNEMRPHISSTFAEIVFIKLCKTHTHTHVHQLNVSVELNEIKSSFFSRFTIFFWISGRQSNKMCIWWDNKSTVEEKKNDFENSSFPFISFNAVKTPNRRDEITILCLRYAMILRICSFDKWKCMRFAFRCFSAAMWWPIGI